jgi:predicted nucleic acid-binding protein
VVKRWVVNASPIISLAKIDRIHLLSELCDEVIIPQGVADEINLGGYTDSADLENLIQVGLRISPAAIAQALALAGEQ